MPVLITGAARSQYLDMLGRYLQDTPQRPARPEAARRLSETYDAALKRIAAGPSSWLTHPRPYPEFSRYGFRWIKLHRYWFPLKPGPSPVITNILDEVGDLPRWISGDGAPVGSA